MEFDAWNLGFQRFRERLQVTVSFSIKLAAPAARGALNPCMKHSHATVALSVIKGSVSINGAVELGEIPNTKFQMTNKYQ